MGRRSWSIHARAASRSSPRRPRTDAMSPGMLLGRFAQADGPPLDAVLRLAREVHALAPLRADVPPRALLVGGFVRDALLGRPTTDADVEIYGVPRDRLGALGG